MSWTAPGVAPSGYDVEYQSRPSGAGWGDWMSLATLQAGTTYTFPNAGGGTTYQFRVRAVNVFGGKTYAGGWQSRTVNPVSNPNQVGSLTAAASRYDDLTSYQRILDGAQRRHYAHGLRGAVSGKRRRVVARARRSADSRPSSVTQLTGAKGASTYQFQVRTVTVSGNDTIYGGWKSSGTVARVPAPGQVTGLTAGRLSTDETKINVSWTAASGGTAATHYEVASRVDGGAWSDQPSRQAATNPLTFQMTGASGKSTYQFRVRGVAVLAVGNEVAGSWTTSGTVSRVGAPNPVTGLTATRQRYHRRNQDYRHLDGAQQRRHAQRATTWSTSRTAATGLPGRP